MKGSTFVVGLPWVATSAILWTLGLRENLDFVLRGRFILGGRVWGCPASAPLKEGILKLFVAGCGQHIKTKGTDAMTTTTTTKPKELTLAQILSDLGSLKACP